MTEKSDDKVEVKVVVESKDSASKVILAGVTVVLLGILLLLASGGGVDSILPKSTVSDGNCGDGIDNDKGGQADEDDPDCYANPSDWEGYDPSRTEANRDNDPPGGRP